MKKDELPKIIVDKRGYFRVMTPDGYVIKDSGITIVNDINMDDITIGSPCTVTLTFPCTHDLTNK